MDIHDIFGILVQEVSHKGDKLCVYEQYVFSLLYDMAICILKRAKVAGWIFLATITRKRPQLTFKYDLWHCSQVLSLQYLFMT